MSTRWKGAFISQKQLKKKLIQVENGKKQKHKVIVEEEESELSGKIEGSRIIDIEVMRCNMQCRDCNKPLCLNYLEQEERFGLASVLMIRCHRCLLLHEIPLSKKCKIDEGVLAWDVNMKATLGKNLFII